MDYMGEVEILTNSCLETLDNPAIVFPYECDNFQKHAFICINNNNNVLITAHTGSGKTTVAEYAIFDTIRKGKNIAYTTPIKSLSNEKYNDCKQKYEKMGVSVGIMTGDNKINPEGNCIIMTAEILWNALFKKRTENKQKTERIELHDDFIKNLGCVIMDEVHFINDKDRGHVWEETIVLLPASVRLVLLSATIHRAEEFAKWVSRARKTKMYLIPTTHRVIPLNHYVYISGTRTLAELEKYKILDNSNNYNSINYNMAINRYIKLQKDREKKHSNNKPYAINEMIQFLSDNSLLQTIFFSFSKRNCEIYASYVEHSLITSEEAHLINKLFMKYMNKYDDEYSKISQYNTLKQYIMKGIAYHHAGLLPIMKEVIEILFKEGLIKILFATETFAVGVNMPTRTVVMTELDKYTDEKKRYLMPSEYKQMSGRAGRRGIDTVGHVIILPLQDIPEEVEIRNIVLGNNTVIKSRIKIDNKIILKILSIGDDINSVMSETLFASENDGIIKTAMKDLDGLLASDKYNESCKNVENMKNIKDIEMLYKLSNTQQVFNGFAVSMSKEQQKKQQKLIKTVNTSDYNKYSEYILINKEISKLKELISENTQYLNNAVENIIEYLIENNYVMKETNELTLKGVIASKINECNPVLLTEMIIQDIFNGLSAPEIVALLAIFIEPEHNNPAKENYNEINIIINKISRINEIIKYHNSKYNQEWEIYNDFIQIAYLWASQLSLNEITEITGINVYIGQFAKNIIKISNIASDMIYLCELSEKIHLIPELNKITGLLIRDFITFSSLYLS